jgi:hypothetical protein
MIALPHRAGHGARRDRRASARRRRRWHPEVAPLEDRKLLATDVTAPVTAAAVVGTLGTNGFYRGPVTINLSATDPDDAPSALTTAFSVNGSPFAAGNAVSLTNDGIYTVQFFTTDAAGNAEATQTLVVKIDQTGPALGITSVNPTSLWPPNGKLVPVTITGTVTDALAGLAASPTVNFNVIDEYHRVQPSGTVSAAPNSTFTIVVSLQSRRLGQDKDGRHYTILVTATDLAGNSTTQTTNVVVPHDQGHRNGSTPGFGSDLPRDGRRDDSPVGRPGDRHGNGGSKQKKPGPSQGQGEGRSRKGDQLTVIDFPGVGPGVSRGKRSKGPGGGHGKGKGR